MHVFVFSLVSFPICFFDHGQDTWWSWPRGQYVAFPWDIGKCKKVSVGGRCCCRVGTEVHGVSSEDLSPVLSDCVALTRPLSLGLASTRSINFDHAQTP